MLEKSVSIYIIVICNLDNFASFRMKPFKTSVCSTDMCCRRPTDADVMDATRPCFVCSLAASENLAKHQIPAGLISHELISPFKPQFGWLDFTWLALCSCFFIPETDIFLAVGLCKERRRFGNQSSSRWPPTYAIRPAAALLRPPQRLTAPSRAELSRV